MKKFSNEEISKLKIEFPELSLASASAIHLDLNYSIWRSITGFELNYRGECIADMKTLDSIIEIAKKYV